MARYLIAFAALAVAAAPPSPKPPARAAEPSPTLELLFSICKLPPEQSKRAFAALPDNLQAAAMMVCLGYDRGQLDLIEMLRGKPGKASAI